MNKSLEHKRLEDIAQDSWYAKGANGKSVLHCGHIFSRYIEGESLLELGPAEGLMTPYLARLMPDITLVDGSDAFCASLRQRFPKARVVHSLFEEFNPDKTFDNIVLGHVLEHVIDPVQVLRMVGKWLSPNGRILAAVPNARSLHRQAAVIMGLLPEEHSLNATDHHHGHRRVYDPESFRNDFRTAGLRIEIFGGYWIKCVSNAQIDETWTDPMVHAFMELGERYPDIAAEIYVVASRS